MNKTMGLQLIVYGVLLAGLSYLVHRLAPTMARPTLITGLVGGCQHAGYTLVVCVSH